MIAKLAALDPPAAPARRAGAEPRPKLRWWLWPHVLSLDAPVIAVVWQHWWARAAGVQLLWLHDAILALGVWMIYLADRLADTRELTPAATKTARHAFSARNRNGLRPLLAGVIAGLVILTPAVLPPPQFIAGLALLAVAGGYFWAIHWPRPVASGSRVPKEAVVGLVFAAGTTFFVEWRAAAPGAAWLLGGLSLFALLCFLNCALITQWEASAQDWRNAASLLNALPALPGQLGRGCFGLAAVAFAAACYSWSWLFLPIALSALALAWLDRKRAAVSADALRVLSDLALLTPLLWVVWPDR